MKKFMRHGNYDRNQVSTCVPVFAVTMWLGASLVVPTSLSHAWATLSPGYIEATATIGQRAVQLGSKVRDRLQPALKTQLQATGS